MVFCYGSPSWLRQLTSLYYNAKQSPKIQGLKTTKVNSHSFYMSNAGQLANPAHCNQTSIKADADSTISR